MKRPFAVLSVIVAMLLCHMPADAQLIQRAEQFLQSAFASETAGDVADSAAVPSDSLRLAQMAQRLIELEANEERLRAELQLERHHNQIVDSAKLAEQQRQIDSLRAISPAVPVVVDGDTLFTLYSGHGGYSADERAAMISGVLLKIGKDRRNRGDSIFLSENDGLTEIMYGDRVIMSISDRDGLWHNTSRRGFAEQLVPVFNAKIQQLRDDYNLFEFAKRAALFVIVIIVQWLLFKATNALFRRLRRRIIRFKQQRLKPIIVRDYELLNTRRLGRILIFFSNILRYIVLLIQLMFSVPVLFAIFPQTEKLALTIFLYIIDPIKMVLISIVDYIPNLFIIIVIWYCIKYIIKGLHYISNEIKNEKLKISGFYPDWAQPTFNIIRFLLYAFMVAMIYPYLPGSNSGVFQGISVFVGLIISLGSSTVIGNIIAGLVITYMRPFKLGDRIKLNDTTGNVIEKTPFVTRLRTPKNEVVTIPNSFIMSSHTVNYSASARQFGLIIHTSVTIGYDVPWRQVHQLLINAARMTPGVLEHPKPFVLETELNDYYPCYQINAYIDDADHIGDIMSALLQNIQDTFNEAGVEIMSPGYIATRDGSASTIPADDLRSLDPQ